MFPFQKEIQKIEQLSAVCSYPYKVIPLSEEAKFYSVVYLKRKKSSGLKLPLSKQDYALLDDEALSSHPFSGQLTFYYDDPKESEEARHQLVKQHAVRNMARSRVKGFSSDVTTSVQSKFLKEGKDYEIQVGDKVVHQQGKELTFDDIKPL
jgi:hypothetical protein